MRKVRIKLFYLGFLIFFLKSFSFSQNVERLGPNYFVAGIPSGTFQFYSAAQNNSNWCWAACIQMVLNYNGVNVTQEQVVMRCFGSLTNQPGGPSQMFVALSGWAYNYAGGQSRIYSNNYATSPGEIQAFLATNKPLIVGLRNPTSNIGHAFVLTAIYYSLQNDGLGNVFVIPEKVALRDPWPSNPSRVEMNWNQFANQVDMCFKVWVN